MYRFRGALLFVLALSAPSVIARPPGGGLVGWVEDTRGTPVAGVVISLFGKGVDAAGLVTLSDTAGRFFLPDEDRVPGRNPVAVLSHDLWRTRFGADAGILGTSVRMNGTAFTVIVMQPSERSGAEDTE